MQIETILETLLTPPVVYVLFLIIVTVIAIVGRSVRRRRAMDPRIRQIDKLQSAIQKDKDPPALQVKTRQDIITEIFEKKMNAVGMTPSEDSGYIPTSQTPLANYLKKYNISDDIIDAIQTGLDEEESEAAVRGIIRAAADTPDVNLDGIFLEKAEEIAVEEWKRRKGTMFR